jgi:hypothetical protein
MAGTPQRVLAVGYPHVSSIDRDTACAALSRRAFSVEGSITTASDPLIKIS